MVRFISFLLGKPYESCKSCEVLKLQLEQVNSEKKELLAVILDIVKPKVIVSESMPQSAEVNKPVGLWSRRRAALEQRDREQTLNQAQIRKSSPFIAANDQENKEAIEALEKELNIADQKLAEGEGKENAG